MNWKNRIVGEGNEPPDQLLANPLNWRTHPVFQQEALQSVIEEVGIVQQVIVNKRTGYLVDGHLRVTLAMRQDQKTIPVSYIDVSEEEERKILATLDPLAAMAAIDREKLSELLDGIQSEGLDDLLSTLRQDARLLPVEAWGEGITTGPDGIAEALGYNLGSFWADLKATTDLSKYFLPLPGRPDVTAKSTLGRYYSRTNQEEIERTVKTYMRPGDRFYEMCCGWMTFSCTAKYFGFNGRGGDIWDKSLAFCKRQLDVMPGDGLVDVVEADCMATGEPDARYDFVHSNPPFFSLEPYSGSDKDMANTKDYGDWLLAVGCMASEAERILRPGGLANFVINDYRERGFLKSMHADFTSAVLRGSNLRLHDIVVAEVISQSLRHRKKAFERRRTVKCHEYVLTFVKG